MSDGTKSIILFFGFAAFFGLMVVGPIAGDLLDEVVTWGAAQANDTSPSELDKTRGYVGTPLAKAHGCCTTACESSWDYRRDICDPGSEVANACLLHCIEAPLAKQKKPAAH